MQIAFLLGAAILPIGAVGVWQAIELTDERARLADAALLAFSIQRTDAERAELNATYSAIDAFIVAETHLDADCGDVLRRFVETSDRLVFGGVISLAGELGCRSDGEAAIDVSQRRWFQENIVDQRANVTVLEKGAASGIPVAVVSKPIREADETFGFLIFSLPRERLETLMLERSGDRREAVALLLGPDLVPISKAAAPDWTPEMLGASAFREGLDRPFLFHAEDRTGLERTYALAPIAPGELYELLAWKSPRSEWLPQAGAISFPFLMWATALVVAFVALERLFVRPITALKRDLQRFGTHRELLPERPLASSAEIASCEESFREMAIQRLRDEALMENALRENQLLLREVHHRVKNNLQIITSLVRMQARDVTNISDRRAIERLQERILGVATAHRKIYEGDSVGSVQARELVDELVNVTQLDDQNRILDRQIDDVDLHPEEALGIAMIVTETLIAAADAEDIAQTPLRIALTRDDTGIVRLEVDYPGSMEVNGKREPLGRRIILASAGQLGASVHEVPDHGRARLTLTFSGHSAEPR